MVGLRITSIGWYCAASALALARSVAMARGVEPAFDANRAARPLLSIVKRSGSQLGS